MYTYWITAMWFMPDKPCMLKNFFTIFSGCAFPLCSCLYVWGTYPLHVEGPSVIAYHFWNIIMFIPLWYTVTEIWVPYQQSISIWLIMIRFHYLLPIAFGDFRQQCCLWIINPQLFAGGDASFFFCSLPSLIAARPHCCWSQDCSVWLTTGNNWSSIPLWLEALLPFSCIRMWKCSLLLRHTTCYKWKAVLEGDSNCFRVIVYGRREAGRQKHGREPEKMQQVKAEGRKHWKEMRHFVFVNVNNNGIR